MRDYVVKQLKETVIPTLERISGVKFDIDRLRQYMRESQKAEDDLVAVLDTLGVHPLTRGMGVGAALMEQLLVNLAGLGVGTLRTEVAWEGRGIRHVAHSSRGSGRRQSTRVTAPAMERNSAQSLMPG